MNPNDSYWTSGSDVHLPEYDNPKPASDNGGSIKSDSVVLSSKERAMLLDRRMNARWNIWRLFDRRGREQLINEEN